MGKRKKKVVEPKEEPVIEEEPIVEEVTEEIVNGLVTLQVVAGSLNFEQGTFEQGDTFEVTEERAKLFDQRDIKYVKNSPPHRPTIQAVYDLYGNTKVSGAEIGVFEGENALNIINFLNIDTLHLIDPYEPYEDNDGVYRVDFSYGKEKAVKVLDGYNGLIRWHFTSSDEACKYVPDDSLEFVYIDGNHSYDFVWNDIHNYLPKVKSGGILGGHDYCSLSPSVIAAVTDFIEETGFDLHVEYSNIWHGVDHYDWWVQKP